MLDLIIVMAIIGMLASVASVMLADYAQQARFEAVMSAVRQQIVEIELEYKETGVMPRLSRMQPHPHEDINRIRFTRRNDHRMFIKVRFQKTLYTSARNRTPEVWYLAEGDGNEGITWSCGSTPVTSRAIPSEKLPSYCRDTIPRR